MPSLLFSQQRIRIHIRLFRNLDQNGSLREANLDSIRIKIVVDILIRELSSILNEVAGGKIDGGFMDLWRDCGFLNDRNRDKREEKDNDAPKCKIS